MEEIISKLANLQFDNFLIPAALFFAALFVCFNGFSVYRLILGVLAFWVGFSNVHKLLEFLDLKVNDKQMLFLQIIFAAAFMMLAFFIRRVGIFFVVFDFVYVYLSSNIVQFIAKKLDISNKIYPYFSVLVAILIALIVALLAIKFERAIVVIVMAWIGGFAAINFLHTMLILSPVNIPFLSAIPIWGWYFMQSFLSLLGMLKQGLSED